MRVFWLDHSTAGSAKRDVPQASKLDLVSSPVLLKHGVPDNSSALCITFVMASSSLHLKALSCESCSPLKFLFNIICTQLTYIDFLHLLKKQYYINYFCSVFYFSVLIKALKLKQKERGKHIKLFKLFRSQKLLTGFLVWIQRGKT